MYFAIRDDDTSFFTKPSELENAYDFISGGGAQSLYQLFLTQFLDTRNQPFHMERTFPMVIILFLIIKI